MWHIEWAREGRGTNFFFFGERGTKFFRNNYCHNFNITEKQYAHLLIL